MKNNGRRGPKRKDDPSVIEIGRKEKEVASLKLTIESLVLELDALKKKKSVPTPRLLVERLIM